MTHCLVTNCKTTQYNKVPGIALHPCPQSLSLRKTWLSILKNKCAPMLDWNKSKICSKHFENRYFDADRKLKSYAIPTLFPSCKSGDDFKLKLDKLMNKMPVSQISQEIGVMLSKLKEPINLHEFITEEMQLKSDAPLEAKLWLIVKKQEHLITRLNESVSTHKAIANNKQKNLEGAKTNSKEYEKNLASQKYIIKSLQERQASLEEQIEILTAIETR